MNEILERVRAMDAPAVVVKWLEDAGSVEDAAERWNTCDAWQVALWLGVHATYPKCARLGGYIAAMCTLLASDGLGALEDVPYDGAPPHEHAARAHELRAGAASLLAAALAREAGARACVDCAEAFARISRIAEHVEEAHRHAARADHADLSLALQERASDLAGASISARMAAEVRTSAPESIVTRWLRLLEREEEPQ